MKAATSEISAYIRSHTDTIIPLFKDYNLRFWDLSISGDPAREKALVAAKERYVGVYNNAAEFRQIQEWKRTASGLDAVDARQLKLISDSFAPHQIAEDVLMDIVARETRIENLFNTFRADFEGKSATDNALRDVLKDERNPARRQAAWESSKQIGHAVKDALLELVRIRNREARKLGYADYHAMMFDLQELDRDWVYTLFDRLEALSEPAYTAMKGELDVALKRSQGLAETGPNYPWLYSDPFFQEYSSPEGGLLDAVFEDQDIEALTRRHYAGIGLDVSGLIASADLYEREGKSQHAFCLDVDHEGDVRVLCNVRRNERWMSTMLHEFGHAVYDRFNDPSAPFLLRCPAHILSTEAIAMLNGRMSKDPLWLECIRGLSHADAERTGREAVKALRAEMLIFMRWAIVLVRFEREMYRDPDQDLNGLWWRLVHRIQKITPPPNRDMPDWAAKSHLSTAPAYYQNYVLGELMASQLLVRIQGGGSGGNGGYLERAEAGDYLKERIFKPGARHPWNEMLARATGEPLNPEHFLRQFV